MTSYHLLFVLHTAFPLQDLLSLEETELLQQALKLSQSRPTAPSLLFLAEVNSPLLIISLLSILLPRENGPLSLCHLPRKTTGCLWRRRHQDFLHLLAARARGLERLPHTEVRFPLIFQLSRSFISCFQPREISP